MLRLQVDIIVYTLYFKFKFGLEWFSMGLWLILEDFSYLCIIYWQIKIVFDTDHLNADIFNAVSKWWPCDMRSESVIGKVICEGKVATACLHPYHHWVLLNKAHKSPDCS